VFERRNDMPIVIILLAVIGACVGCKSAETPQEAVARVGAETLMRDIDITRGNIYSAHARPSGVDDAIIPRKYWSPAIVALKPQYVYFDGQNIVIILQTSVNGETGLYVEHPYTSVGFNAHKEEGERNIWSGTLIWNGSPRFQSIYAVTRKGKHNEAVQLTP
jgi:hypothetical protein